jgi:hypothetical protein
LQPAFARLDPDGSIATYLGPMNAQDIAAFAAAEN